MTTIEATPSLPKPRLDVGLSFKGGWNAFTADIVPLLVGGLIAGILSVVTLGILAGPLVAGLYSMVAGRIRDGRRAEIGDVFSCMDRFWSFLGAAIVLVVLIGLASLTIIGGVLLATIWLYVIPLMVDRKMGIHDAMTASYYLVGGRQRVLGAPGADGRAHRAERGRRRTAGDPRRAVHDRDHQRGVLRYAEGKRGSLVERMWPASARGPGERRPRHGRWRSATAGPAHCVPRRRLTLEVVSDTIGGVIHPHHDVKMAPSSSLEFLRP